MVVSHTCQAITVVPSGAVQGDAVVLKNAETIGQHVKKIQAGSWASVAATATNHGNHIVKFRPGDGITRKITETAVAPVRPQDARVIWIKPWNPEKKSLSDITEKIDQGPLFSIAHSQPDNAVCVIFQHAHHARAFLEANMRYTKMYGQGLFGPDSEILEGQAYPATDDIRRMDIKNERRRLTFARSRLFSNGVTEVRFKNDIFAMVGEGNVELVWLFNSGNGTMNFPFLFFAVFGQWRSVLIWSSHSSNRQRRVLEESCLSRSIPGCHGDLFARSLRAAPKPHHPDARCSKRQWSKAK
jgi:hypothetical protein